MAITLNGTTGITTPDIDSTTYGGTFSEDGTYLRLASGTGGIQFNGDTASANALDDYEEGTFTATLTAATPPTTPPTSTANYTKIGNQVTVRIRFANVNTSGGSGVMKIQGLPFTISGDAVSSCWSVGLAVPNLYNVALPYTASTEIGFWSVANNASGTEISITAGTGKYLMVTATYLAS